MSEASLMNKGVGRRKQGSWREKPKNAVQCGCDIEGLRGVPRENSGQKLFIILRFWNLIQTVKGHWKVFKQRNDTVLNFWKINSGQIVENDMTYK